MIKFSVQNDQPRGQINSHISNKLNDIESYTEYYIWIWEQQDWEVDQEIDGKDEVREDGRIVGEGWQEKVHNIGMEEAPENGKESSHSTHAKWMNEYGIFPNTAVKYRYPTSHFL